MKKNSLVGLVITFCLLTCASCTTGKDNAVSRELITDSCLVRMDKKKQDSAAFDVVVTLKSLRQVQHNEAADVFSMDNRFELLLDSTSILPVFCQPLATGDAKKYVYLLSFEPGPHALDNRDSIVIRMLPNYIVRDTVDYKL